MSEDSLFLGLDLGTSGCRVCIIDSRQEIVASAAELLPASKIVDGHITQNPWDWFNCCLKVLRQALSEVETQNIRAIAIDGTSGSVLLCDQAGEHITNALMYNDAANVDQAAFIKSRAPRESGAHGSSSGLAKCLSLLDSHENQENVSCLNQADWIAGKLAGRFDFSDENNALKMGYDVINRCWPTWLTPLPCSEHLPQKVYQPGDVVTEIDKNIARQLNLPMSVKIVAGTTDSIAAFVATGCDNPGDAVTSLGSTLAIKLISDQPVYAPEFGVYSHRLGDVWLVGGASNSGGAVIKKYFDQSELDQMTPLLNPQHSTGLDYYPLLQKGERFPINDPDKRAELTPRPEDNVKFFQAILEGIANIEKQAYDKLMELGAGFPKRIITMGGGSQNPAWQKIREQTCQVPITNAHITEAAYGAALLASKNIT